MDTYISLHNHTDYSNLRLLDCINTIETLVDRSAELGMSGVALTDHESLSGSVKFLRYIENQKKKGNLPADFVGIVGDECYLIDSLETAKLQRVTYFHFILLAKDKEGYLQLKKISSQAWENRFIDHGMERVPITKQQLMNIIGDNKGHLIVMTACLGGELANAILANNKVWAGNFIYWCIDLFGSNNFYLEMQPGVSEQQVQVNKAIVKISESVGVPFVITTDAHYPSKEYASIHEAFLKSRSDESREVMSFYESCYIMSAEEIHERMDNQIGRENVSLAFKNSIDIAHKVESYELKHRQIVPKIPIPEFEVMHLFKEWYDTYPYLKKFAQSEYEVDRYFYYQIEQGWIRKDAGKDYAENKIKRINEELGYIWDSSEHLGDRISNYYVTFKDIKDMVWDSSENGGDSIVGYGRGSVAAMYTCYLTGVQDINSYDLNIPAWRHLHPSRPELPDVDFDSEGRRRERILEKVKNKFGERKVLNVCTFKTEGSRSALQTAARGLGLSVEESDYLSTMIPYRTGSAVSLEEMIYGNEEEGTKPDTQFINECKKYPNLLDSALMISGLISGRSIHASGVVIFTDDYTELSCGMCAPNGAPCTQFDLGDSEYCGALKYDFLSVNTLDMIHQCMDFLLEFGYIQDQGSLRKTFEKYFSSEVLNYTDKEMWEKTINGDILNLFQFDTAVGSRVVKKTRPSNFIELGVANSLVRLQPQGDEMHPVDRYVLYKNNKNEWYKIVKDKYGLTEDEIAIIEKHLKHVYYVATTQEEAMLLSMDEYIGNFNVKDANVLRKGIAKKKKSVQEETRKLFYRKGIENGTRKNMLDYVWNECITPMLKYSFSTPHIYSYNTIALCQMNMNRFYPPILWDCAVLVVESGSDINNLDEGTDYEKVGEAITNMQHKGITILPVDVNTSEFGFRPNIENNTIIYGLKSVNGIGDKAALAIINNRPYTSFEDFYERMYTTGIIRNTEMIKLIKSCAFQSIDDKDISVTMNKFLKTLIKPIDKLTLAQLKHAVEMNVITEDDEYWINYRMTNYKRYVLDPERLFKLYIDPDKKMVKSGYHDRYFLLDKQAQDFFKQYYSEDNIVDCKGEQYIISEKKFTKEVNTKYVLPLMEWMNQPETVEKYNYGLLQELKDKYAKWNVYHQHFQSLSYYPEKHALYSVNRKEYGIVNFFDLPIEPPSYEYVYVWVKGGQKEISKKEIVRIFGTVLGKNKDRHVITLLTPDGIVKVKMSKERFLWYNRREVGKKSWFDRGTMLLVTGFRQDNVFRLHRYKDTVYQHTISKVLSIEEDGTLVLQNHRHFENNEEV